MNLHDHTPYYYLGRLCRAWLENYEDIDKKYPKPEMHERCRYINVQDDVVDIYIKHTGDKYPNKKADYLKGIDPQQDWYQRILDYTIKHEDIIINMLLGKQKSQEIDDVEIIQQSLFRTE